METGYTIEQPPHGYVRYIDHMGTDSRIVEAARVSYKSPSKGEEADKKLLFYLFKNRHTSPFEQCSITFNIKLPIFLMRQFVRHRTFRLNEWSGRYSELTDQFYFPDQWRGPDPKNKQGSVVFSTPAQKNARDRLLNIAYESAYQSYRDLLLFGVAKELARIVLPVGIYTEIYVNCDLHNLLHFLRLRLDSHAQKEMRDVAQAMKQIACLLYPWTFDAFSRFTLTMKDNEENTPETV